MAVDDDELTGVFVMMTAYSCNAVLKRMLRPLQGIALDKSLLSTQRLIEMLVQY